MKIENIKFKAKRLDNGEWVYGSLIRSTAGVKERAYIIDNFSSMSDYSVVGIDPSTVCQFTGLRDKNGEEVWEHDFLVSPCLKGEVIFNNGCFRIKKDDGSSYPFTTLFVMNGKIDYCRIDGNMFDRKEGEK